MPDEIKVDAANFDTILGRTLTAKPLSKAKISTRAKAQRDLMRAAEIKKLKEYPRTANKLGG